MLTVNDIRDVKFRKTNIGGYKAEDVDNFWMKFRILMKNFRERT